MSCDLRPITVISRRALLLALTVAAAPSAAFSQSSVCHSIRGGETATQLARRITGDGRNKYQPWFQIMDASSRFVPKSQYDRVRPGWRACIVKETIQSSVLAAAQKQEPGASSVLDAPGGSLQPASAVASRAISDVDESPLRTAVDALHHIGGVDLTLVWLGAAVVLPLFGWRILDNYAARRKTRLIVMQHFAQRFVNEFERPLIQQPAERPVRSRLRLSPGRARLDILLAPARGRRYPNLSDHKKNMEYDVVRIQRLLGDDSFVRDPLYTQAGWVVVPFRFKAGRKYTGVTCISFF
jgi:hypothetical protein